MPEVNLSSSDTIDKAFAAYDQGDFVEAERICRAVLKAGEDFDAFSLLSTILLRPGRYKEALAYQERALALRPESVELLNNRGIAFQELKRFAEALQSYDRALALRPDFAEALNNRGIALQGLGRAGEALTSCDRAVALRPDYADAYNNRGNILHHLSRFEEAIASYDRALAIRPQFPDALKNRGMAFHELKRFDEALAGYDRALALRPDDDAALWRRAYLLLLIERYSEGWIAFDKARRDDLRRLARQIEVPEWVGGDPRGKRLLFRGEAGLGDTIQFARFAQIAAARGGDVTLEVQAPLGALLKTLPGVTVIRRGEPLPVVDATLPLMSAPRALNATKTDIPIKAPYIFADPVRVEAWSQRLSGDGFKIGIVWQGNPTWELSDPGRSFPVRCFEPLSRIPSVRLISLQKRTGLTQLEELPPGMMVESLDTDFDTGPDAFIDSAAVAMNLDLVITSDTSMAHLVGALGRPVWIALRHMPDWRWHIDRGDSAWYPTARLFRQTRRDEWGDVFERMAAEVAGLLAKRSHAADIALLGTAQIPISFGELVDKITILEIKVERIADRHRNSHVKAELDILMRALDPFAALLARNGALRQELRRLNESLWFIEERIRECERRQDFGAGFIELARDTYKTNDRRASVKRQLSELAGSALIEEKSYLDVSDPTQKQ